MKSFFFLGILQGLKGLSHPTRGWTQATAVKASNPNY